MELLQDGRAMAGRPRRLEASSRLERVLDEAEHLFLDDGFLHLTSDDLARHLRCSKRTLYALAPSRERFFELIIERHLRAGDREMMAQAMKRANQRDQVTAYLDAAVRASRRASTHFVRDLTRFPPGKRIWDAAARQRVLDFESIIESGIKAGVFSQVDSRVVAEALLAASERMLDPDFLADTRLSLPAALKMVFRVFNEGLLPRTNSDLRGGRRSRTPKGGSRRRMPSGRRR